MEKNICLHKYCDEEFNLTTPDRLFCSRKCKQKHRQRKRYYEDRDYYNKQNLSAKISYKKK